MAASLNWWEDKELLALRKAWETGEAVEPQVEDPRPTDTSLSLAAPVAAPVLTPQRQTPAANLSADLDWWDDEELIKESKRVEKELGVITVPAGSMRPDIDRGLVDEGIAGTQRGLAQTVGMLYGFTGMVAEGLGMEPTAEWANKKALEKLEDAKQFAASIEDPYEEIEDASDTLKFAVGAMTQFIPDAAISLLAGGVGGLGARAVAGSAVKSAVEGTLAKRLATNLVTRQVEKQVAAGATRAAAEKAIADQVTKRFLKQGLADDMIKKSALGGAYAVNYAQNAGDISTGILQQTGETSPGIAALAAAPNAALDTLFDAVIGGPILGKLVPGARAPRIAPGTALADITVGPQTRLGRFGQTAQTMATTGLVGGVTEGVTEGVQTAGEQLARGFADPRTTPLEAISSEEAARERNIAAAYGFAGGLGLGGAGGIAQSQFTQRTQRALQNKLRIDQVQSQMRAAEQARLAQLGEGWEAPVDIGNGVMVARRADGSFAAFNLPEDQAQGLQPATLPDGQKIHIFVDDFELGLSPGNVASSLANLARQAYAKRGPVVGGQAEFDFMAGLPKEEGDGDYNPPTDEEGATPPGGTPPGPGDGQGEFDFTTPPPAGPAPQNISSPGTTGQRSGPVTAGSVISPAQDGPAAPPAGPAPTPAGPKPSAPAPAAPSSALESNQEEILPLASMGERGYLPTVEAIALAKKKVSAEEFRAKLNEVLNDPSQRMISIEGDNAELQQSYAIEITARQILEADRLNNGPIRIAPAPAAPSVKGELDPETRDTKQAARAKETLKRPAVEAAPFVEGLNKGDRVSVVMPNPRNRKTTLVPGIFAERLENGDSIFQLEDGQTVQIPKTQSNRVSMLRPEDVKSTKPVAKAIKDQLGPAPSKAKIEQTFGVPNYTPGQTLKQTIADGNGDKPIPVLAKLLKKKGTENDYVVENEGEFTNDPLTSVRQMNAGLPIYLPENQDLNLLSPDIEVTPVEVNGVTRNKVSAVNLWGRTYRQGAETSDFSVSRGPEAGLSENQTRGLGIFNSIYRLSPERLRRSAAGMQAARTREQGTKMKPEELNKGLENLDPVDRLILEDNAGRAINYINRKTSTKGQATTEDVQDAARFAATDEIMTGLVKAAAARSEKLPETSAPVARRVLNNFNEILGQPLPAGQERDAKADAQRAGDLVAGELQNEGLSEAEARAAVDPIVRRLAAVQSPISIAEAALKSATKTTMRREANRAAATADLQEGTVGETPTVKKPRKSARPLNAAESAKVETMAQRRDRLSEEDLDLITADISGEELTGIDAARVEQIKEYLDGNTEYETLYPQRPDNADAARGQTPGRTVSGPTESRARGSAGGRKKGRAVGVGRANDGKSGTVPGAAPQQAGGSGIRDTAGLSAAEQRSRALGARRFLIERFFRLTGAEIAAATEAQINRAFEAITTILSPDAANQGRRVVAFTEGQQIADLANTRPEDLLAAVGAERIEGQKGRKRAEMVRRLGAEMFRAGAFDSTVNLLEFIANNKSLPRDMQLRAKAALGLRTRGFNWANIATQIGIFRNKDGSRTTWAGLLGKDRDGGKSIAINLDNGHDRGTAYQTFLHEIQHVLNDAKWDAYYGLPGGQGLKLNKVELAAIKRVEDFWKRAVLAAAKQFGIDTPANPTDAEFTQLGEQIYDLSDPTPGVNVRPDRRLAALRNPRELSVEITSSPDTAELLAELGFGKADKEGRVAIKGAVKEAWDALVQLEAGTIADPDSPLAMAFKASMAINFAGTGDKKVDSRYTVPDSAPSRLTRELDEMRTASDFVEAELEARGLPGTSEQRAQIVREYELTRREPTQEDLDEIPDPVTMSRAVTPQMDREYLAAVQGGDMETAQRMVDSAASASENQTTAYRSNEQNVTVFDTTNRSAWFTSDLDDARDYAGMTDADPATVTKYYLNTNNFASLDDPAIAREVRDIIPNVNDLVAVSEVMPQLRERLSSRYDGVEVTSFGMGYETTHYNPFNPEQIKSADPVTYDKSGNVIPLSQRFNVASPDIRESRAVTPQENLNTAPQMVSTTEQTNETESRATSDNNPNLVYQDSEGELRGRPRAATDRRYLRGTLLRLKQSSNEGRDLGAGETVRFRADSRGQTDLELEQQRRRQGAEAFRRLIEILEEDGAVLDPETFENTVIEGRDKIGDGSEHQVHSDKPTNRVIKYTNPDVTGSGVVGQSLNVFDYLANLEAQNEIFGDDIRLEGIVYLGEPYPRVVISQPFVKGRDSTPKEIDAYFTERGFEKQEDGSWFRLRDGQIQRVWDAVPGNLKTVKVGKKSTVVPFDVQVSIEPVAATESRAVSDTLPPVPTDPMPMSAVDVLYRDSAVLPKPAKKIKNAEVASLLAEVAQKYWGFQLDSENITPEIEQIIVANGVEEFILALRASGKNAADWYSTAIEVAMEVAGVIHPEITNAELARAIPAFSSAAAPDKAAQLVMRIALAVTSQNLNVNQNAGYAEEQYAIFRSTGKFDSSKIYGEKAESISGNLELANQLISKLGFEGAEAFIQKEFSVDALQTEASNILGRRVKIAGKKDDLVNGAALFGPKIGQGFLQNLMGRFTPVTIDLWMRRTWGRWTGDVVGDGVTDERMAKLLDAAREDGLQIPESLRSLRTVERKRKNGKSYKTMSSTVADRLETDLEFRASVEKFAAEFNSRGQAEYRLTGQPVTPRVAASVAAGNIPYKQFIRDQQRVKDGLDRTWDRLRKEGKKPAMSKANWVAEQHRQEGRTEVLDRKIRSGLKPLWSRSAKVIIGDLNPIDIPSPQDRRVITRIVNKIREDLSNRGYSATNADIQAVLWYPEKDLWAKLRGEEESNLKLSYDDEFIAIAEKRGLGEQARAVASRIRADRAARIGGQDDARTDRGVDRPADEDRAADQRVESRAKPDVERNKLVTPEVTVSGPALYSIAAYHGTPFDIPIEEGFRQDRIGSGEGNAAFGYGFYFAEVQGVSKGYAERLSRGGVSLSLLNKTRNEAVMAWREWSANNPDEASFFADEVAIDSSISLSEQDIATELQNALDGYRQTEANIDGARKTSSSVITPDGAKNVYTVSLDVEPNQLLDWDRPLSEQPETVRRAIERMFGVDVTNRFANELGSKIYDFVGTDLVTPIRAAISSTAVKQAASKALLDAGIKGIRYLDGDSRQFDFNDWRLLELEAELGSKEAAVDQFMRSVYNTPAVKERMRNTFLKNFPKRTYNYVIFDENLIKITERNGQPVSLEQAAREQATESRAVSPTMPEVNITPEEARRSGLVGPLYHGSPDFKGRKFTRGYLGRNTGLSRSGVSFTDDLNAARGYALEPMDAAQAAVDSANDVMREVAEEMRRGLEVRDPVNEGRLLEDPSELPEFNVRYVDDMDEFIAYADYIADSLPANLRDKLKAAARQANETPNPIVAEVYLRNPREVTDVNGKKLWLVENPDDIFVSEVQLAATESRATYQDIIYDPRQLAAQARAEGFELVYHGDRNQPLNQDYSAWTRANLPLFTAFDPENADWFGEPRPLFVRASRVAGYDDMIAAARAAGIEGEYGDPAEPVRIPEVSKHSPYEGTNENDLLYIPKVREELDRQGFDAVRLFDQLERDEVDVLVVIGSPDQVVDPLTRSDIEASRAVRDPDDEDLAASEALNNGRPVDTHGLPRGERASDTTPEGDLDIADAQIDSTTRSLVKLVGAFESATDKLRRGTGLTKLAGYIDNYFDLYEERLGLANGLLRRARVKIGRGSDEEAVRTFESYMRARENKRAAEAKQIYDQATEAQRAYIDAWETYSKQTGAINTQIRTPDGKPMQVYDTKLKKWRPIQTVKDFFPRTMRQEVQAVLQNPALDPALYNDLLDSLVAAKKAESREQAQAYLKREYFGTDTSQDYFAGVERGRREPLPEIFYDYSVDAIRRYMKKWAQRTSQIQAFGQATSQGTGDWFDNNITKVRDPNTRRYLNQIKERIYEVKEDDAFGSLMNWLNVGATGLQLGNPATAFINLFGGSGLTVTEYGWKNTIKAAKDVFSDWKNVMQSGADLGIVGKDLLNVLNDADMEGSKYFTEQSTVSQALAKFASFTMKWGGYSGAENFVRATTMLAARGKLMDGLRANNTNPSSSKARWLFDFAKRENLDVNKLILENGAGPETGKFLRRAVNVPQGSYRIDMTPIYVDQPLGRFLFKYQKFGTQLTRMFWRHHLQPFIEKPDLANFSKLLHFFSAAIASGTIIVAGRAALFGYPDPGPDEEDLKRALANKDTARAWGLIFSRAWHSMNAAGALGFFGNYFQFVLDWRDQQRVKNPLKPPGLASIDAVVEILSRFKEQGKLTGKDIDEIAESTIGLYRANKRIGLSSLDAVGIEFNQVKEWAAEKQIRRMRKYSRMYAEDQQIEGNQRTPDGRVSKTPMSPLNRDITLALRRGDAGQAKVIMDTALKGAATKEEREAMMASIQSSVRYRQPLSISGRPPSSEERAAFFNWARRNAPPHRYESMRRLDEDYRRAASRLGINIR